MEEQFYTLLTDIGKAKIANATALQTKVKFSKILIGDGNGSYYEPTQDQTKLKNKVWEGGIGNISIDKDNPNWIVLESVIPSSVGGFTIREVGITDAEGDLVVIAKYPSTYKPKIQDGSTKDLIIKTILEVTNTECVTLKVDPTIILATKKDIKNLEGQFKSEINNIDVPVKSVNSKTGEIELTAADIKTKDGTTLEKFKEEVTTQYKDITKKINNIDLSAEKVTLHSNVLNSKNVKEALEELFQSGNNVKSNTVDALLQKDNSLQISKSSNWTNIINAIAKMDTKKFILAKDICGDNYILTKRIYLGRTTRQDFTYSQNFTSYFNTAANTLFLEIEQTKYKYVLNKDKQVILDTTSGLLDNVILLNDGTVLSYSNNLFKKFSKNGKKIWEVDLKKHTFKDEYFKHAKIKDNYYIEETNCDRYIGLNLSTGEVSSNQQMKDIYYKAFQNEDYFVKDLNSNSKKTYIYKNNYFTRDNDGNVARHETIWSGSKTVWNVKTNSREISIIGFKDNLIVVSRKPKNGFKNSLLFYNVATGEKVQEIELPEEEDALFMSEDGTLLTSHKIYPENYIIFYLYKDKIKI